MVEHFLAKEGVASSSLVSRSIKNKHPSGCCFFIVRVGLRTRTKRSFVAKFERERAEAEVAETLSFRHVMPFIASEQDSLVSRSIFKITPDRVFFSI